MKDYKKEDHILDGIMLIDITPQLPIFPGPTYIDGMHVVPKSDFELNILVVLKAAYIHDIAELPKYLTHDSAAVRNMAEMRYRRLTEDAEDK